MKKRWKELPGRNELKWGHYVLGKPKNNMRAIGKIREGRFRAFVPHVRIRGVDSLIS
jgi:hypothetical protein